MNQETKINLTVEYFALLREQAGRSRELIETSSTTASELFEELKNRYRFTLSSDQMRIAINDEFRPWDEKLSQGDILVFIPPVAGG